MGKIVKKRKLYVSKKPYYRRIAQMRKAKWVQRYQLQHDEQFKFHFCQNQDPSNDDSSHKHQKNENKADQKIKNRVAAQQSREKRKFYVEDLERKLMECEEMLETQVCRQCSGPLKDKSDSDLGKSDEKASTKESFQSDDIFQQGLIRIDNQGVTTPFGIFFVVCVVAVIAVIFSNGGQTSQQRLLANSEGFVRPMVHFKEDDEKPHLERPKNFYDSPPDHGTDKAENLDGKKKQGSVMSNLQSHDWVRYGDLMCTRQRLGKHKENRIKPFLGLRSASNLMKEEKPQKDDDLPENSNGDRDKWTKGDLLSCIVYN